MTSDDRSDWQRRYDESLERERQKWEEGDNASTEDLVAMEAASTGLGCIGSVPGLGIFATAGVVLGWLLWRRSKRRRG